MYWLVGNIEGLPDGHSPPVIQSRTTRSTNPASSSSSREPSTSTPPPYSIPESESSDAKWLRGSVRSERRIALSHNPNPDGGVSRLDDDFTHDLPGFGTCRVQVRVNEVRKTWRYGSTSADALVVCGLPVPTTPDMPGSFSTGNIVLYPGQTRGYHHHHTSPDRQIDDNKRRIHHYRARSDTTASVHVPCLRLSCSLARFASRWSGCWRFNGRCFGKATLLRSIDTHDTSRNTYARVR